MLTVCCVFVRGPYPYTADYVVRLERMVRRYYRRPFRFVCLTDRPELFSAPIETVRVKTPKVPDNTVGIWTKLQVFRPDIGFTGRVLFLDLDTLVVAPLDPIVDVQAPFATAKDGDGAVSQDRYGRTVIRRFNSSVMAWDAETAHDLYRDWNSTIAWRLSTDQDWIAERRPDAHALPRAWFPRISQVQPPWPADAKVVLVKKPKNHVAAATWPWFEPLWGGWQVAT